ncbi:MAG: hypothetical protein Q8Q09_04570 [Deltaproteobacteria bacterium]|nr:hypothetical protein [Deltaproteobacteria bacterium]
MSHVAAHDWLTRASDEPPVRRELALTHALASASLQHSTHPARSWQASHRTAHAFALTLDLTAQSLSVMLRRPALYDLTLSALTTSAPEGHFVDTLTLRWGRVAQGHTQHDYRASQARVSRPLDVHRASDVREGFMDFLTDRAEESLAYTVSLSRVTLTPRRVELALSTVPERAHIEALRAALRPLLAHAPEGLARELHCVLAR